MLVTTKNQIRTSKKGGGERQRRPHSKSKNGCNTCKERHLRCDEVFPVCIRCQVARRTCKRVANPIQFPTKATSNIKGFRYYTFEPEPSKGIKPILRDVEAAVALEYFHIHTLPVLANSQPSFLWQYTIVPLLQSDPILRNIAISIGAQQRLADRQEQDQDHTQIMLQYYSKAIKSLREVLADNQTQRATTVALACLLLVVLESMRDQSSELLVHVYGGLRISREFVKASEAPDDIREIVGMLEHFTIGSAFRENITTIFIRSRDLVWGTDGLRGKIDDLSGFREADIALNSMLGDVLQASATYFDMGDLERLKVIVDLLDQQEQLEYRLRENMSQMKSSFKKARYGLLLARCSLSRIYIKTSWMGLQTPFDDELESFRANTLLFESCFEQLESHMKQQASVIPGSFSLGFGAISSLSRIMVNCRDPIVRRRALNLLDKCPRREGLWVAEEVKMVGKAIIEFEEQSAEGKDEYGNAGFIPENGRIHFFRPTPNENGTGNAQSVLVLYNPNFETGKFMEKVLPLQS